MYYLVSKGIKVGTQRLRGVEQDLVFSVIIISIHVRTLMTTTTCLVLCEESERGALLYLDPMTWCLHK